MKFEKPLPFRRPNRRTTEGPLPKRTGGGFVGPQVMPAAEEKPELFGPWQGPRLRWVQCGPDGLQVKPE